MSVSPHNGGTVDIDGKSYTTYPVNRTFGSDKSVILEAVPAEGYMFSGWSGNHTDMGNPAEIITANSENITAYFSRIMNLDIGINGRGSTDPSTGRHSYAEGEIITIVATPNFGWRFDSWTGDVSDSKSSATNVNMVNSKDVTANFVTVIPVWLLTLIVIVAAALIGAAGYYFIHRKSMATKPEPVVTDRPKAHKSRKRRKNKRG